MATTQHDYYELLGVARDASDGDIKRAFRKLARELHPDVNDAPDAEERFRQVAEAYEVLSKPESRQLYDRFGHAGLRSGGFQPGHFDFGSLTDIFSAFFGDDLFSATGRPTRSRGADLVAEVEVELVEAARGATREVSYGVAVTCAHCSGNGAEPGTPVRTCETCGGAGRVQQVARSLLGEFVRSTACSTCGGAGRIVETACRECSGAGRVAEERTLRVDVPAGIHDGQRIRLTGEGHVGDGGGRAGDVYVQVRVRPDPRFVREGNDVFSTVDLTITQAALGASLTVPTLEGEVQLDFDPGTQAGTVRVLRGKGMPVLQGFGRGDQRVLVNVVVPRRLTDEQRDALEQFDRLTDGETYRDDGGEGFFDKLKSAFR